MSDIGDDLHLIDSSAESAVIAAALLRPEARRKLMQEIGDHHFAYLPNRTAWNLIAEMHRAGVTIDPGIFRREIASKGLEPSDINEIFRNNVSDAAIDVSRVVKLHRHRWALQASNKLRAAALDLSCDILGAINEASVLLGNAVRSANRRQDGIDGMKRLRDRMEGMIAGAIRNIEWPSGPMMSSIARALESGSITLVGGMPGDGKTFLILQSLIGWIEQGIGVAVCMLEKRDAWHLNRCLALLEENASFLHAEWVKKNPAAVREAMDRHEPILTKLAASIYETETVGSTLGEIGRWIDATMDEAELVVVDPISLADAGDKRWIADADFIKSCIRTTERTNGRVVLVTHPNATKGVAALGSMMGGQVYQRATDTVLYIEKFDKPKRYQVMRVQGVHKSTYNVQANRRISVFKGRNATQGGSKFAFSYEGLQYAEQGLIIKESRDDDDEDGDDLAEKVRAQEAIDTVKRAAAGSTEDDAILSEPIHKELFE